LNEDKDTESTADSGARRLQGAAMGTSHFAGVSEDVDSYGKTWKKLLSYSRVHLPIIAVSFILIIAGNILHVIVPDRLRAMTDIIQNGIAGFLDIQAALNLTVTLAVIYLCIAVLNFFQSYLMAGVTAKISGSLRTGISEKINKLPLGYFGRVSLGDVVSRVSNDVDTIGQTLNQNIGMLMSSSVLFLGSLVMMLISSWILALTAIVTSAIGFLASKAVLAKSKKYFKAQQGGIGAVGGFIEETYSGHNVVRAYNGVKSAREAFAGLNRKLYIASWKAQFVSGFITPLMSFSGNLAYVAVAVVGAVLVMRQDITFGVIVAFIMYVNQFTQGLTHIAETVPGLQSTTAASERVFDLLDERELDNEGHKTGRLTEVQGDVEFSNVRFGYEADKPVIHDFSAHVKAGQKVAIVGPTGAGKTTIVNLLMRFYELDGGEIRIDGTPISHVTRQNLHDQFGMVLQDTWLLEGTLRQNIVYNKAGVSDELVEAAGKAAGLHGFVSALPDGYDTVLSAETSLSEGQKQLVTIARAMIRNAPMLILDEATSSVDTRTEAIISKAMDKLMEGRTSFVIAHRLSTIRNADLILVLKDGDVIESGGHDELLSKGGFYSELYRSQFEIPA